MYQKNQKFHKRNRIFLLSHKLYPCKTGGMEIYNSYLTEQLLQSPIHSRITVLTACKKLINEKKGYFPVKEKGFLITRFGIGAISTLIYYSFSKSNNWKNVDVVYIPYTSNFTYNALPFLILKYFLKVDYVVHIHGGGLGLWKPHWLLSLFFKHARKIAGVSPSIVEEYSKRSGRTVQYLPPLVPFARSDRSKVELRQEKGLEKFEKIIIYVGSIKPLKAPETLIKAFVHLGEDFIEAHRIGLILLGDGPLKNNLQRKYASFSNIVFGGQVPNQFINEYYALADIYVIPSRYEGTPISLLEAMFNRLPCVGANVSGISDILEHGTNGYLFEKDREKELSNILKNIISDEIDGNKKAENAFQHFQKKYNYYNHLLDVMEFIEGSRGIRKSK